MATAYVIDRQSVVSESFDDDTILINFATGTYFSLRGTAPFIWNTLQTPVTIEKIVAMVASNPADAQDAVSEMIETLVAEQCLLPVEIGESEIIDASTQPRTEPYTPPIIETFRDLQELITIDPVHEVEDDDGWPRRRPDIALDRG